MADIRKDFARTAEDLARVAQDAAYVAIGLGVVGFQKAQVARRELGGQLTIPGPTGELRTKVTKALQEIDKAVGELIERADAALDPLAGQLPVEARALLRQAQESRDDLRRAIKAQIAA